MSAYQITLTTVWAIPIFTHEPALVHTSRSHRAHAPPSTIQPVCMSNNPLRPFSRALDLRFGTKGSECAWVQG